MSQNPITGDALRTKPASEQYRAQWDQIFGKKPAEDKKPEPASKPA